MGSRDILEHDEEVVKECLAAEFAQATLNADDMSIASDRSSKSSRNNSSRDPIAAAAAADEICSGDKEGPSKERRRRISWSAQERVRFIPSRDEGVLECESDDGTGRS